MKKISLLFAALLTLALTTRAAYGDTFTVDNLVFWVENEHEVALAGYDKHKPEGALSIPAEVTNDGNSYSVTIIGSRSLRDCVRLTSVIIPNSVTNIDVEAFSACESLLSVTIPNSVTTIGQLAFANCSALTSVTIPNSVTEIGGSAFANCEGMTSVTIPNSVTSIGAGAFGGCKSLQEIIVENGNNNYTAIDGILYNSQITELITYPAGKEGTFEIPNYVTGIGASAFSACSGLTSVTIHNSVTDIGAGAFASCSGLTSVTIPNSVSRIGEQAFWGCNGLTSVSISNSVTVIRNQAFARCEGLTSVTIPNSVTDIEQMAFGDCKSLISVIIPNSVTNIESFAFQRCSRLTTIIAQPTTPPACFTYTFYEVPQSAVVYIPKGTLNKYAAAEGWNYFTDFRETEDSGIEGVEAGSDTASAEFFRLNGMRVKGGALAPGLYLKRLGGKTAKVLVK